MSDGRRHRVSFTRNRGRGTITVDGVPVYGTHDSSYLAAPGDLYIGKNKQMISHRINSKMRITSTKVQVCGDILRDNFK